MNWCLCLWLHETLQRVLSQWCTWFWLVDWALTEVSFVEDKKGQVSSGDKRAASAAARLPRKSSETIWCRFSVILYKKFRVFQSHSTLQYMAGSRLVVHILNFKLLQFLYTSSRRLLFVPHMVHRTGFSYIPYTVHHIHTHICLYKCAIESFGWEAERLNISIPRFCY